MNRRSNEGFSVKTAALILAIAVIMAAFTGLAVPAGQAAELTAAQKATALSFHDTWRKLWEDHIIWTRMVIIGIVDDVPGVEQAKQRLLENYEDMETTLKPYYGDEAETLGDLIGDHLLIAVEILEAAKANDTPTFNDAVTRWYANADEIAMQMNGMNSRFWQLEMAKNMWKDHLDATLAEATARLQGNYPEDVQAFERVHLQALGMADFFSNGVVRQFPFQFKANGCLLRE